MYFFVFVLLVLVHHYHTHHTIKIKVTVLLCTQAKLTVSEKNMFQWIRCYAIARCPYLRHVNVVKRHVRLRIQKIGQYGIKVFLMMKHRAKLAQDA